VSGAAGGQGLGALEIGFRRGLGQPFDGAREVRSRSQGLIQPDEGPRSLKQRLAVIRLPGEKAVQSRHGPLGPARIQEHPAAREVHEGQGRADLDRPVVVGLCRGPVSMMAMKLAAIQIQLGVVGISLDLHGEPFDALLERTMSLEGHR
jgi:hypothetical protein